MSPRRAYSLVEVLVACAVLAIATALTLSAVQRSRAAAARAACANSLRQIGLALHLHAGSAGAFPGGCEYPFATQPEPVYNQCGLSWQTRILPYLDQAPLWERAWAANRTDPRGYDPAHFAVMAVRVPALLCPAEGRVGGDNGLGISWALTSFAGVSGTYHNARNGVLYPSSAVRFADILDGTSNTVAVGERPPGPSGEWGGWYANWGSLTCRVANVLATSSGGWVPSPATTCPSNPPPLGPGSVEDGCSAAHFWSHHPGGAHFLFCDGAVRFVPYSVADLLPALATRAGNDPAELP